MDEWDYERNWEDHRVTPDDILSVGSKYHWICKKNVCGCHRWEATLSNRVYHSSGCPYCCNKKVCVHSSIRSTHPEVCKQWNYRRNTILPETISKGSGELVWWICENGHEWTQRVCNRINNPCPQCRGASSHESLESISWDSEESISRESVESHESSSESSRVHYVDLCEESSEAESSESSFQAPSKSEDSSDSYDSNDSLESCESPDSVEQSESHECSSESVPCRHCENHMPFSEEDTLTDEFVKEIYRHVCGNGPCGCHYWQSTEKNDKDCPYCNKTKVCIHESIFMSHPKVLADWDYSMNDISPANVSYKDSRKMYWICMKCPRGYHSWKATIREKLAGKTCSD